jgi:alpha-D-ribose 1-methylphosphonate 5-triphosphate synthase subunit PhnH
MDAGLDGGFANPVLQSQTVFRAIMDALANPGTVQKVSTLATVSGVFGAELRSVLLSICDHDTSIWLDDPLRADAAVLEFVNFHTGAPVVREPGRAMFAFATGAGHLPRFDQFNLGTQEYPDRSTTIVLAVPALTGGAELITRGPGIKEHGHISPVGLPEDFVGQWASNRELFPRGIDLLLVAPGEVMGLPRSTRIAEGH